MSIESDIESMKKALINENIHGPFHLSTVEGIYDSKGFHPWSEVDLSNIHNVQSEVRKIGIMTKEYEHVDSVIIVSCQEVL